MVPACKVSGGIDCRCDGGQVGDAVCTDWQRLRVYRLDVSDHVVCYIATGCAFLACLALVVGTFKFYGDLSKKVRKHDRAHAEPGDYTVIVRNLPHSANIASIRAHFSDKYDLSKVQQAHCPAMGGMDRRGCCLAVSLVAFFGCLALSAKALQDLKLPQAIAIPISIGVAGVVANAAWFLKLGAPVPRPTPANEWDAAREVMPGKVKAARSSKVLPAESAASEKSGVKALDEAMKAYAADRPRPMPCADAAHVFGNEAFLQSWVADVQVSHPFYSTLINLYQRKLKKAHRMDLLQATFQKRKSQGKDVTSVEFKYEALREQVSQFDARVRTRFDPKKFMGQCGVAFVTFENEESALRCVEDYRGSSGLLRLFQPTQLRFGGRRITVERAPAPSNILWENLDVPRRRKWLRSRCGDAATLLVLIASAALIRFATKATLEASKATPDRLKCRNDLPAIFYGTYAFSNTTHGAALTRNVLREEAECTSDQVYLEYAGLNYDKLPPLRLSRDGSSVDRKMACLTGTGGGNAMANCRAPTALASEKVCRISDSDRSNAAWDTHDCETFDEPNFPPCDSPCVPRNLAGLADAKKCYSLACYRSFDVSAGAAQPRGWLDDPGQACYESTPETLTTCYCYENMGLDKAWSLLTGAKQLSDYGSVCEVFMRSYFRATILKFLAAVLIMAVNEVTQMVIYAICNYERHDSKTSRISSLVAKLVSSMFVNTAILSLLINSAFSPQDDSAAKAAKHVPLLKGSFTSFSKAWYVSVGAALTITMLVNTVSPQLSLIARVATAEAKRVILWKRQVTQVSLDALYAPPPWQIERSYAIFLNTLLVTVMFAGGLPVLLVFALISFKMILVVNKVMVLKYCRQPPNFDKALGLLFAKALVGAALLHVGFVGYMFSESELLHSESIFNVGLLKWLLHSDVGVNPSILKSTRYDDLETRMARLNVAPFAALFFLSAALVCPGFSQPWACVTFGAKKRFEAVQNLKAVERSNDASTSSRRRSSAGKQDTGLRCANAAVLYRLHTRDFTNASGVRHKAGEVQTTWAVMAGSHLISYNMADNPDLRRVAELMAHAGFVPADGEERLTRPRLKADVEQKSEQTPVVRLDADADASDDASEDDDGAPASDDAASENDASDDDEAPATVERDDDAVQEVSEDEALPAPPKYASKQILSF
ncbi:hypothetical protein M885DRAFT_609849 [Pelagophyceae sp. CCMP2097]|nr:hypothetical protein M885DRAFT_609849 [Pelagophyceae sp. CCMP2097]